MDKYKIGSKVRIDVLWTGDVYTGKILDYDETTVHLEVGKDLYFIEHELVGKISYLN